MERAGLGLGIVMGQIARDNQDWRDVLKMFAVFVTIPRFVGSRDLDPRRRSMMEDRLHYVCRVRIHDAMVFILWFSGERDGFVRDEAGRLLTAATAEALTVVAESRGVSPVACDPADYALDQIRAWCSAPEASGVDCPAFLNAWNFFDDMAGTPDGADTPRTRPSRAASECYDKLFWGCNPPAVTPPGERFEPAWRSDELTEIRRVLETGLRLVESELRVAGVRV